MSERKVYQWVGIFQRRPDICGWTSLRSPVHSRQWCANVVHVDALIGEYRRISVDTVATMLNISDGSAHGIIYETLKCRCVPDGCWDSWPMNTSWSVCIVAELS
jgi:hypothetical protein